VQVARHEPQKYPAEFSLIDRLQKRAFLMIKQLQFLKTFIAQGLKLSKK